MTEQQEECSNSDAAVAVEEMPQPEEAMERSDEDANSEASDVDTEAPPAGEDTEECKSAITDGAVLAEEETGSDVSEETTSGVKADAGRLGIAVMKSPSKEDSDSEAEDDTVESDPQPIAEETVLEVKTLHPLDEAKEEEHTKPVTAILENSQSSVSSEIYEDARSVISSSASSVQLSVAGSVRSSCSTRSRKSLAISMDGALHETEREETPMDVIKKRRKTVESFRNSYEDENVIFLDPEVCKTFCNQKELPAPKGQSNDDDTLATDGNETYHSLTVNKVSKKEVEDKAWQKQRRCILLGLFILVSSVLAVVCFLLVSRSQSETSTATSAATIQESSGRTDNNGKSCLLQRTIQDQQFIDMELYLKGVSEYVNPTQERQLELAMKAAFNQAVGGSDGCGDMTQFQRWMIRADLAHQAMMRDFVVREQGGNSSSSFNTVLADTSFLVARFHTEISCKGCVAEQAFATVYPSFFGESEQDIAEDSTTTFMKNETDGGDRRLLRSRRVVEDLLQEEQEQHLELNAGNVIEKIEQVMKTILPNLERFEKVVIVTSSEDGSSSAVTMQRSGSSANSKGDNGNDRENAVDSPYQGGESAYGFTPGGGYRPTFARNQVFSKVSTILDCATIKRPRKKRKKGSKSNKSDKSSKSGKSGKSSKSSKSSSSSKKNKSHDRSPSSDDAEDGDFMPDPSYSGSSDSGRVDSDGHMNMDDDALSFSDASVDEEKEEGAYDWYITDPPSEDPGGSVAGRVDVPTTAPSTELPTYVPTETFPPSYSTGVFLLPTKNPSEAAVTDDDEVTTHDSAPTDDDDDSLTDDDEVIGRDDPTTETGANDIWRRCDPEYDSDEDSDSDLLFFGRLDNPPCSVCGPDQTVTKFSAIVSSSLSGQGTSTCGLLQLAGNMGHLRADVCAVLPTTIKDVCGCAAA